MKVAILGLIDKEYNKYTYINLNNEPIIKKIYNKRKLYSFYIYPFNTFSSLYKNNIPDGFTETIFFVDADITNEESTRFSGGNIRTILFIDRKMTFISEVENPLEYAWKINEEFEHIDTYDIEYEICTWQSRFNPKTQKELSFLIDFYNNYTPKYNPTFTINNDNICILKELISKSIGNIKFAKENEGINYNILNNYINNNFNKNEFNIFYNNFDRNFESTFINGVNFFTPQFIFKNFEVPSIIEYNKKNIEKIGADKLLRKFFKECYFLFNKKYKPYEEYDDFYDKVILVDERKQELVTLIKLAPYLSEKTKNILFKLPEDMVEEIKPLIKFEL